MTPAGARRRIWASADSTAVRRPVGGLIVPSSRRCPPPTLSNSAGRGTLQTTTIDDWRSEAARSDSSPVSETVDRGVPTFSMTTGLPDCGRQGCLAIKRCSGSDTDSFPILVSFHFELTSSRSKPMTESLDIYAKVRHVLAECLGVDEDEIMPEGRLQEDLGGGVDRLPGHRVSPGAAVQYQDPAGRALSRVDLRRRPQACA